VVGDRSVRLDQGRPVPQAHQLGRPANLSGGLNETPPTILEQVERALAELNTRRSEDAT
jgi:hypothetical protein